MGENHLAWGWGTWKVLREGRGRCCVKDVEGAAWSCTKVADTFTEVLREAARRLRPTRCEKLREAAAWSNNTLREHHHFTLVYIVFNTVTVLVKVPEDANTKREAAAWKTAMRSCVKLRQAAWSSVKVRPTPIAFTWHFFIEAVVGEANLFYIYFHFTLIYFSFYFSLLFILL